MNSRTGDKDDEDEVDAVTPRKDLLSSMDPMEPAADRPLKPLLLSHSAATGGAAVAGSRIFQALRECGVPAEMRVRGGIQSDPHIHRPRTALGKTVDWLRPRVEVRLQKLQRSPNQEFHSSSLLPSRWSRLVNSCDADIVNLHWVALGAMSVEDIGSIAKPLVMTLHDMWAFCGAEHYAPEDRDARWRVGYHRHNRPQGHRGLDLDRRTWKRKYRAWRQVPVICPSEWLARCARDSALMEGWPIHVIPYALDLEVFRPIEKYEARSLLNLPQSSRVVLFGAFAHDGGGRKGYDLLLQGLEQLADPRGDTVGVVFGQDEPEDPPRTGIKLQYLGRITDNEVLARLYSAADVMVVPSRQDNLPQTATEAQACGTPVVGFASTGVADVVEDRETGYLAEDLSPTDLARGISWVLGEEARWDQMRAQARARAVRSWHPRVVTSRYLDVYREAIDAHAKSHLER